MSLKKKDPSAPGGGLRVAANDPHLVSLGGGRLSTAVTIHYIPIGSMTIGSSPDCTVSLNGSGVKLYHCTLHRNEMGEVKIQPNDLDARILIDGNKITSETNLTQGAMITIGNSNYLRFNNPAEAQMIKSTMGSNERISMPQIDFTQDNNQQQQQQRQHQHIDSSSTTNNSTISSNKGGILNNALKSLTKPYDQHMNQNKSNNETILEKITKIEYININNFHSPKVFTADSITVNAPAKDVLGPKYANFTKNLATNHKNDKNYCVKNNEMNFTNSNNNCSNLNSINHNHSNHNSNNRTGNYVNIPQTNFIQNSSIQTATTTTNEILTKVNNSNNVAAVCNCTPLPLRNYHQNQHQPNQYHHQQMASAAYDRYPKLCGGLQLFPMNGINSEINVGRNDFIDIQQQHQQRQQQEKVQITPQEQERLDEILKICTEYERENQHQQQQQQYSYMNNNASSNASGSHQSSPIVQNRIKTNGSLPRDKKSPFFDMNSGQHATKTFFPNVIGSTTTMSPPSLTSSPITVNNSGNISSVNGSGYENVRLIGERRIEMNASNSGSNSPNLNHHQHYKNSSGYENVIIGKYTPQSPRTKIRTTCTSPQKKDTTLSHTLNISKSSIQQNSHQNSFYLHQQQRNNNNSNSNSNNCSSNHQSNEYAHLIQTFEDKLKMEIQAIQDSKTNKDKQTATASASSMMTNGATTTDSLRKRQNLNINNLTLNLNGGDHHDSGSSMNSLNDDHSMKFSTKTTTVAKSATATATAVLEQQQQMGQQKTRDNDDSEITMNYHHIDDLKKDRENVLSKIRKLKTQIADIQRQEDEVLRELDLEKALVSAEMSTVNVTLVEMEKNFKSLQAKIHRLEAQRNANRVMQETQQAKLKQTIEVKQEQVTTLQKMLKDNENDESLKEEYEKSLESLENDRKTFEDLEFQYLEEETDWMAYREELHSDLKNLTTQIENKQVQMINLQSQGIENQNSACTDTKTLENDLLTLLKDLERSREELQAIDKMIYDITGEERSASASLMNSNQNQSDSDEDEIDELHKNNTATDGSYGGGGGSSNLNSIMSQSLFGSTEILSAKSKDATINSMMMSRSINENMFFNNKIEMPTTTIQQNQQSGGGGGIENVISSTVTSINTSTPKKELKVFEITENFDLNSTSIKESTDDNKSSSAFVNIKDKDKIIEIIPEIVKREHNNDEKDPILKLKYNVKEVHQIDGGGSGDDGGGNLSSASSLSPSSPQQKINLNLSLEGDDFEVNPLDKRVPSQDDIDRICKVTLDAPISTTKGASSKIIESIKEIERNRQLLLAQQGSHVIEHERQKMLELKKRCHDEARAQYLSSHSIVQQDNCSNSKPKFDDSIEDNQKNIEKCNKALLKVENSKHLLESSEQKHNQQRHSHPEFESQRTRPLSDVNYENLKEKQFKSNNDLTSSTLAIAHSSQHQSSTSMTSTTTNHHHQHHQHHQHHNSRCSDNSNDYKRSSLDEDRSYQNGNNCNSNSNKRTLPKHQRPLTRYLPIMSPDLDLRQHIESAGHQIALCPHVIIDSYSCRGYLHKLGATFHGWSRRWFVLDRQKNAFIYYSDRSERKPRGGAYFSTIEEVYLDHLNTSKSGRPHCTFIVKTKRRSYHLQAASDAAARIWIDAIITGAQGNLDY